MQKQLQEGSQILLTQVRHDNVMQKHSLDVVCAAHLLLFEKIQQRELPEGSQMLLLVTQVRCDTVKVGMQQHCWMWFAQHI